MPFMKVGNSKWVRDDKSFMVVCYSFTKRPVCSFFETYSEAMKNAYRFNPQVYNHVIVYRKLEDSTYKDIATVFAQ